MDSAAVVEQEIGGANLHYIVIVISNVLRKNSAENHQALGTGVHRLVMRRHGMVGSDTERNSP